MGLYNYESNFIEIKFPTVRVDGHEELADNFLKVKETLTRIGAPAYAKSPLGESSKTLWQSCHILHKKQRYWLVHFKEMFLLDGKESRTIISENDLARRNAIALLLEDWGLIEIVDKSKISAPSPAPIESIKIIPYRDKNNWELRSKYEIGKVKF
jgi:hypothetical protein